MQTRTSLSVWRASFLAALGIYPVQSLVACSSDTESNAGTGTGGMDSGISATGGTGTGGSGSGGKATGGSGGKAGSGGNVPDGATATGGTGGKGSGGTDSGPQNAACKNPQPVVGPHGEVTGYVLCDNGWFHRTEKKECPSTLPRTLTCGTAPVGDAGIALGQCHTDSDCKDQPNGYCQLSGLAIQGCYCNYGCRTDADCPAGNICACTDFVGQCVSAANCTVDSDCGADLLCLGTNDNGCSKVFACQTKGDTCAGDSDCKTPCTDAGGCLTEVCSFVQDIPDGAPDASVTGKHECQPPRICGTGRPFLVGGAARVAETAHRSDWSSSLAPDVTGLDANARSALARYYTDVALMEHASIAAFARFALDLLALGAPPELVAETHAAMADETVHARDAFALASTYASSAVGPGSLVVDNALSARTTMDVVETAILEGCIGETVAAVEAAEALAHATDPAVRAALERVARDETRHAELAFRFVRWVMEAGPVELRRTAGAALARIVSSEMEASREAPDSLPQRAELLAHGALDAATRLELRARVLRDIVAPCVRELRARVFTSDRDTRAGAVAA